MYDVHVQCTMPAVDYVMYVHTVQKRLCDNIDFLYILLNLFAWYMVYVHS